MDLSPTDRQLVVARAGAGGPGPGPAGLEALLGFLRPAFVTLVISSVFVSGSLQVFAPPACFPLVHLSLVIPFHFTSLATSLLVSLPTCPQPVSSLGSSLSPPPAPSFHFLSVSLLPALAPAPRVFPCIAQQLYIEPRTLSCPGLSHSPSLSTRVASVDAQAWP